MRIFIHCITAILLVLNTFGICFALSDDFDKFELEIFKIDHSQDDKKTKLTNLKKLTVELNKNDDYSRFWYAVSLSMMAKYHGDIGNKLDALNTLKKVRAIFTDLYAKEKCMFDGNVALSLAVIYFYAPLWPVSFGDLQQSQQYFEMSRHCGVERMLFLWKYGEFLTTKKPSQRSKGIELLKNARSTLVDQASELSLHRIQEVDLILKKYDK